MMLVPANAAEAIAEAFPSYAALEAALRTAGSRAVENLIMKTEKGRRVGPAIASNLLAYFSTTDPDYRPG